MPEAVILNPYGHYASALIDRLYRRYGVRTICLHSTWRARLRQEGAWPVFRSPAVSAHYQTDDSPLSLAQQLRRRHDVVGVVPHDEGSVRPLSELAGALGLSWAQPQVLPAFRDKFRLKSLVASADPTVRLNAFMLVHSADEVLEFAAARSLRRFVLKPNSGSGNNDVAFFDAGVDRAEVQAYFDSVTGPVLMEEFIAGPEYWVNGQTDADGEPTVVGVGHYLRIAENGKENLEIGGITVARTDPAFEQLRQYAIRAVRATGLRRSPFHVEVIIDDKGPCLVEMAARFCGELTTVAEMWQHGLQLDLFDVAAHYYVNDSPYGPIPVDWTHRDRHVVGQVSGTSAVAMRVVHVEGIREVEQSPHFLYWNHKPHAGDFIHRKVSLTTQSWSATVQAETAEQVLHTIDWMRATVRLRGTHEGPWTLRQRMPMYSGLAAKAWSSRLRPHQLRGIAAL